MVGIIIFNLVGAQYPEWFHSRFGNKLWYTGVGAKEILGHTSLDLPRRLKARLNSFVSCNLLLRLRTQRRSWATPPSTCRAASRCLPQLSSNFVQWMPAARWCASMWPERISSHSCSPQVWRPKAHGQTGFPSFRPRPSCAQAPMCVTAGTVRLAGSWCCRATPYALQAVTQNIRYIEDHELRSRRWSATGGSWCCRATRRGS